MVGNGGKARGEPLGREFSEIIDQGNRTKLRDQVSTFDFRNERDDIIIKTGNIHRPKPKTLDDLTNENPQLRSEFLKEGN